MEVLDFLPRRSRVTIYQTVYKYLGDILASSLSNYFEQSSQRNEGYARSIQAVSKICMVNDCRKCLTPWPVGDQGMSCDLDITWRSCTGDII